MFRCKKSQVSKPIRQRNDETGAYVLVCRAIFTHTSTKSIDPEAAQGPNESEIRRKRNLIKLGRIPGKQKLKQLYKDLTSVIFVSPR